MFPLSADRESNRDAHTEAFTAIEGKIERSSEGNYEDEGEPSEGGYIVFISEIVG